MRIAVIGGGPGGLYFAAAARRLGPDDEVTVWERNPADDASGFGIIVSDWSLGGVAAADPAVDAAVARELVRWDGITVHAGERAARSGGHGLAAMSRASLQQALRRRCAELGVTLMFRTEAPSVDELAASHDLVVAADGAGSRPGRSTPTPSGPKSRPPNPSTSGWAPIGSSTSSSCTSWRPRTG
ncbi:lycopene cyclase family protein [Actinomadura sp. CNU-125]|uniref:lycopene cyclase family protein n=1 Tax=Actinomadura sp. CNU-125 TaxID=1904961 RepID=UPI002915DE83|nr:lycopene cyclase family protein [Actinomadura sp. CNU-125]